ncbi:hypothetical protein WDZ92_44140, partial [Nostoc sp. NIES-2111]
MKNPAEHDDPNGKRLAPEKKTDKIAWKFSKTSELEYWCLISRHPEAAGRHCCRQLGQTPQRRKIQMEPTSSQPQLSLSRSHFVAALPSHKRRWSTARLRRSTSQPEARTNQENSMDDEETTLALPRLGPCDAQAGEGWRQGAIPS